MSKIIDITDKLTFEENPRIRVKDVEIELNANALDFYETLGMMNEKSTNMDELTLRLAATPSDVDKIKALKVRVRGFCTLRGIQDHEVAGVFHIARRPRRKFSSCARRGDPSGERSPCARALHAGTAPSPQRMAQPHGFQHHRGTGGAIL